MLIFVGLGNYIHPFTRHNMGMMALDYLVEKWGLSWSFSSKCKGWVSKHKITSTALGIESEPWTRDILLFKPKEFMNLSGIPVKNVLHHHNASQSQLYILHDDLERKLGKVTIKNGGSANGHNGLRSIISELNTQDFKRIRLGIDRPALKSQVAKYVLQPFSESETEHLEKVVYPLVEMKIYEILSSQ